MGLLSLGAKLARKGFKPLINNAEKTLTYTTSFGIQKRLLFGANGKVKMCQIIDFNTGQMKVVEHLENLSWKKVTKILDFKNHAARATGIKTVTRDLNDGIRTVKTENYLTGKTSTKTSKLTKHTEPTATSTEQAVAEPSVEKPVNPQGAETKVEPKIEVTPPKIATSCKNTNDSTIKTLMDMGIKKSDAEILTRICPSEELLEALKLYKEGGSLDKAIPGLIEEYNALCRRFGRSLNFGGYNSRIGYPKELGDIDIMTLTRKHRALKEFKNGQLKCKQLPESLLFTEEEKVQKSLVDNAFKEVKGTEYDMFQYRGECLSEDFPYFQKLKNLKEGDVFDIPGYAWTTDSSQYAFGTYANGTKDMLEFFKKWNVKHYILCPEGTKIFASRSRIGQEFLLPCDSKMKLVKKVIDEAKREILIYSEHIPV